MASADADALAIGGSDVADGVALDIACSDTLGAAAGAHERAIAAIAAARFT
jgi:hypothetical protein